MKRKIIIPAVIVALAILSILVFWHQDVATHPILVFKGYDPVSALEHAKVLKFELRNTTKGPIWFCGDDQFPFRAQITLRPEEVNPLSSSFVWTTSMKVAPNESVIVEWVVLEDAPPVQVGVAFRYGNFKNDSDFEMHCLMPPPTASTPWKDKIYYYWNKYYHPRHVIAWPEPLTFQTENPKPN